MCGDWIVIYNRNGGKPSKISFIKSEENQVMVHTFKSNTQEAE